MGNSPVYEQVLSAIDEFRGMLTNAEQKHIEAALQNNHLLSEFHDGVSVGAGAAFDTLIAIKKQIEAEKEME